MDVAEKRQLRLMLAPYALGLVALVALIFMKERPLGAKSGIELAREQVGAARPEAA